jgi:hypothetical protein
MGLFDQSPLAGLLTGYLPTGIANMQQGNQAIRQGAQATLKKMRGQELTPEEQASLDNSPIGGMGVGNIGGGGAFMGTFAGIKAMHAPRRYLGFAQKAIAKGMDPEVARQKYGWYQDKTGDWKWEISDHKAELLQDPKTREWRIRHPQFEQNYPGMLRSLKIGELPLADQYGNPYPYAEYHPDAHRMWIRSDQLAQPQGEGLKSALHELQHAVQEHEGHSSGSAQTSDEIGHLVATEYWPRVEKIENEVAQARRFRESVINRNPGMTIDDFEKLHPDWAPNYDTWMAERRAMPGVNDWVFKKYLSAQGEVDARDTMNRMSLTPEQRKLTPPGQMEGFGIRPADIWDMRDVARQIVPPPPTVPELTQRRFPGLLTPEQGGMALSLLGIPLMPNRAE